MKNHILLWMFVSGIFNTIAYPRLITMEYDGVIESLIFRIMITVIALTLLFYSIYIIKNIDHSTYISLLRCIRAVYPFTWRFIMRKKGRRISPFTKSDFVRWRKCLLAHLSIPVVFIMAYDHGDFTTSFFIAGWVAFIIEAITITSYDLKKPNPQG